jgi:hypothetical protein
MVALKMFIFDLFITIFLYEEIKGNNIYKDIYPQKQ